MNADRKVWLEVALNGPWGRDRQQGIPVTVEEIVSEGIACAKAGAAIVHVHAYDAETGLQKDDADLYSPIIEGIQAEVDVIVYPSVPLTGDERVGNIGGAAERFAAVAELGRRGLIEWAVVDPGSVNFERYADLLRGKDGFIYRNPPADISEGLDLAERYNFHPSYAIYEPGFLRLGAELARARPEMPTPIYRFMFSDEFTFGFAPRRYALNAYLQLLEEEAPGSQWMVAGLGVEIDPLIEMTLAAGGHLRVGLEDAVFGTSKSNVALVEEAVEKVDSFGGKLASAEDVRHALKPS
jgi:uncharacterized protein (DUF849 family)